MSQTENFYEVLTLTEDATEEQIKNIYKKLSLVYHPDKNSSPLAPEKFKQINEAYETLSNEESRRKYDVKLKKFKEKEELRKQKEIEDAAKPRKEKPKVQQPPIKKEIIVTFEEMLKGSTKSCSVMRLEPQRNGEYKPVKRVFDLKVQSIWEDGTEVLISGQGHQCGTPGDVIFTVKVKEHPTFIRDGNNLICTIRVKVKDAEMGKTVKIPRLCNKSKPLEMKPGQVRNSLTLQLKNEGLPHPKKSDKRGNLIVKFEIYDTFCCIPL